MSNQCVKSPVINKDTVEEFWDLDVLEKYIDKANLLSTQDFLISFGKFLNADGKIWGVSSGRSALQKLLKFSVSDKKKSVLICSFNCPHVAYSVINAGLKVETFDFFDQTGKN